MNQIPVVLKKEIINSQNVLREINDELTSNQIAEDTFVPSNLKLRLDKTTQHIQNLKQLKAQLEESKLEFTNEIAPLLNENKSILEKILSVTEFSGEFEKVERFQEIATTLQQQDR